MEILEAVGLFIEKVGPLAGIVVFLALLFRVPVEILLSSRAKRSDVEAEDERVKAETVATLNHTTRTLIEAIPAISTSLRETAASQKMTAEAQHTQASTMNQMALTLKEITANATKSGAAIATHMEVANTVQAASTTVAAETRAAIGTALGAGSPILTAIETFTETLRKLTDQIRISGDVDEKLREDILAQMKEINGLLTRSEAKVERAKEKVQDEKPNEATPVQTTVELTGLLTSDVPSGDKPGGSTR